MDGCEQFSRRILGEPAGIKIVAQLAGDFGQFIVGRVGDIHKADGIIFAIPATRQGLVQVLKPVRADNLWIRQRAGNIIPIAIGALYFAKPATTGVGGKAAIPGGEMEFTDDDGPVNVIRQLEVADAGFVFVETHHVTIPRSGADGDGVHGIETGAQVEFLRQNLFQFGLDGLIISRGQFLVEGGEIRQRQLGIHLVGPG